MYQSELLRLVERYANSPEDLEEVCRIALNVLLAYVKQLQLDPAVLAFLPPEFYSKE